MTGCVAKPNYAPKNVAGEEIHLDDCTETVSKQMGWSAPQVPEEIRLNLIAAASAWAIDNRYAPCEYRMCATIREYSDSSATVYISYDVTEPNEVRPTEVKGIEELVMTIGPEAEVTFDLTTFAVVDDRKWHSGCRFGKQFES